MPPMSARNWALIPGMYETPAKSPGTSPLRMSGGVRGLEIAGQALIYSRLDGGKWCILRQYRAKEGGELHGGKCERRGSGTSYHL